LVARLHASVSCQIDGSYFGSKLLLSPSHLSSVCKSRAFFPLNILFKPSAPSKIRVAIAFASSRPK
jgi:hypothetical protein